MLVTLARLARGFVHRIDEALALLLRELQRLRLDHGRAMSSDRDWHDTVIRRSSRQPRADGPIPACWPAASRWSWAPPHLELA